MTSNPTPSRPRQIRIRGRSLPPSIWTSDDVGKVVAVLLPLANREYLLGLLMDAIRARSSSSHPVVVLDGGFHEPCSPASLAPHVSEGVSDALFFGASPRRLLVDVSEDERWFFMGSGTPLPVSDAGWLHPGWSSFLTRVTPSNGTVLLLLPGEFASARALARQAHRQTEWTAVPGGRASAALRFILILLVVLSTGLAWMSGWLEGVGVPGPDPRPSFVDDYLWWLLPGRS